MIVAVGVFLRPAAEAETIESLGDAEVASFVDEVVARYDYPREALTRILAEARILPEILRTISRPAEAQPWYQYRRIFLTPARIEGGVYFWHSQADNLERAKATYGVAPEIIIAILGVETLYGQRTGSYRVLDALATLAFRYPQRSMFFRQELQHFFLLAREERFDPLTLKGSYAGAMGIPQFISSSYRHYAVDFDNDGVRDLFHSPADIIGSVANYLQAHRWILDGPVAVLAEVQGNRATRLLRRDLEPYLPVGEMQAYGVSVAEPISPKEKAGLLRLETDQGYEYWVGFQNFYTITRYNRSPLYAMAVYQLAQEILVRTISGE